MRFPGGSRAYAAGDPVVRRARLSSGFLPEEAWAEARRRSRGRDGATRKASGKDLGGTLPSAALLSLQRKTDPWALCVLNRDR